MGMSKDDQKKVNTMPFGRTAWQLTLFWQIYAKSTFCL